MRVVAAAVVVLGFMAAGLIAPTGRSAAPYVASVPSAEPTPGSGSLPVPSEAPMPELEAVLLASGLNRPTSVVAAGEGRVFVTEKSGVIRVVEDGVLLAEPLIDLDAWVPDHRVEQGLFSIALHPGFTRNRRFFVNLTDRHGDVRILEYRMAEDGTPTADPDSGRLVMHVTQPGQFHNGGMLQFGPDGYLYASFGDGHFGESARNARRLENVLGSIVRLDIDSAAPYAVPADNPLVGTRMAAEIWVYGMRNPWRFHIDPVDRVLVIADVGQFTWEEITVVPLDAPALDLGWPIMEAFNCHAADECESAGKVLPAVSYSHAAGCAVVGGPVYRGDRIPELHGMVVYADFCTGFVRAFGMLDGHVVRGTDLIEQSAYGPILSLGTDDFGEILILTQAGELRRLQPTG